MEQNNGDQNLLNQSPAGKDRQLIFGVYPGGVAGSDTGLAAGPPDDPARIQDALTQLQGDDRPFVVRGYVHYNGKSSTGDQPNPQNAEQYASNGRKLDLVLCFHYPGDELDGWLNFIRESIHRYAPHLAMLQVTEEPNLKLPGMVIDGCFPNVRHALVQGVIAAKEEVQKGGYDFPIGFSAAPTLSPDDDFWSSIGAMGHQAFVDALDYVGLDFYADVFWPVAPDGSPGDLRDAVLYMLKQFREVNLPAANIPLTKPMHVSENGWPTGPERTYERQASVIETTIRTIHAQRQTMNIKHYELFALRDAKTANPDLFHQFGIMRDDYTPKPAFDTYCQLIAELGASEWR